MRTEIQFKELPDYLQKAFKKQVNKQLIEDFEKMGFGMPKKYDLDYEIEVQLSRTSFCVIDAIYYQYKLEKICVQNK